MGPGLARRKTAAEPLGITIGWKLSKTQSKKDHEMLLEWVGGKFDPEAFDMASGQ
jgi:hypothetical protein